MKQKKVLPYEETAEKHIKLMATASLIGCPTYLLSAVQKIGFDLGGFARISEIILGLTAVAIVVPICCWDLKRMDSGYKKKFFKMEGFVFDTTKRALVVSWLAALFFIVGLKMAIKNLFSDVPAGFFLELVLVVMLGVFGLTFFVLNRGTDHDLAIGSDLES